MKEDEVPINLPDWQISVLEERFAAYHAEQDDGLLWSEVKKQIIDSFLQE